MPNSPSAIKRIRSDAKKRERNQSTLAELRTLDKKFRSFEGSADEARKVAKHLVSRYDRAASRGIIPKNQVSRKKSRVEKFLTKLSAK